LKDINDSEGPGRRRGRALERHEPALMLLRSVFVELLDVASASSRS
jgi:hypothetical protein